MLASLLRLKAAFCTFRVFAAVDVVGYFQGDAFRCAGCPFLGKPAFEKGQEKTIMLADLDAQQDD